MYVGFKWVKCSNDKLALSLSHSLSFSFVCVCVCVSVKIIKFRIECDTSTEHWYNQYCLSLLCVWNLCPSVCVIVCVWFALKKNYRVNFIDQLSDVKITLMCNVYKSFQSDFFGVQIGVFSENSWWAKNELKKGSADVCVTFVYIPEFKTLAAKNEDILKLININGLTTFLHGQWCALAWFIWCFDVNKQICGLSAEVYRFLIT